MKVTANRVQAYGGKEYAPGEEIDMKDTDAKLLIATGRVSPVKDDAPAKDKPKAKDKGKLKTKPMQADEDARGGRDKGHYKRRDVRAEDQGGKEQGED